jgi:hypothetical protein
MGQLAIESDASKRHDSVTLRYETPDKAQIAKEQLEELQRHDRKLREEAEARREKGGKKYAKFY